MVAIDSLAGLAELTHESWAECDAETRERIADRARWLAEYVTGVPFPSFAETREAAAKWLRYLRGVELESRSQWRRIECWCRAGLSTEPLGTFEDYLARKLAGLARWNRWPLWAVAIEHQEISDDRPC